MGPAASTNPHRRTLLRQERSQETRRRLLRAAAELWAEQGFEATTVEQICAAAGVGRTTYYFHFEGKEQLVRELAWATSRAVAEDVEELRDDAGLDARLEAFVTGLARRMEARPRGFAGTVLRAATGGRAYGQAAGDHADDADFGTTLTDVLAAAQRHGELRADADVVEIGAILNGMVTECLFRWADDRTGGRSLRDSLALRLELVLDGLRTPGPSVS